MAEYIIELPDNLPLKKAPLLQYNGKLVRCKDCKWHTVLGDMLLCESQDTPHTYDWFCGDGEECDS